MNYSGPCLAVDDVEKSRIFYETVLEQKVKHDFGENITFEGNFAIQLKPHFAKMIQVDPDQIVSKSNNFEIAFETEDLHATIIRVKESGFDIEFLHEIVEHPWGQRVIRFYDPSQNLIEVGEDMRVVCKRFLSQGYSVEETAAKTQFPVSFVEQCQG